MKDSIILNGEAQPVELPCTLATLLARLGMSGRPVVIEQNGNAVAPDRFPETAVCAGDRLEIISIVAGG